MMWLTWRQFRAQAIVAAGGLAVTAIVLAVSGVQLADRFSASGVVGCHPHGSCEQLASNFLGALQDSGYQVVFTLAIGLIYAVPALIGVFWGAPMITREIETGTFRLAWTQSVTRTRWLAVKVGLAGLIAVATAGLLSVMLGWWANPVYLASAKAGARSTTYTRFLPELFGVSGIAPIGYAAFAFAIGMTFGVLIRRPPPRDDRDGKRLQARRLDRLEPNRGRCRSPVHRTIDPRVPGGPHPGLLRLPRQAAPATARHLPAGQQVLGIPVVRDGDLRGPRAPARVVLLLADQPAPPDVTAGGRPAGSASARD
jgi:hypothetical protein